MPQDLSESVTGSTELVFPDDAVGTYSLRKRSVYDASEVREELETDIPQYGSWLPVELENGDDAWLNAPSELRAVLVADSTLPGDRFQILTIRSARLEQHHPK